MAEAKHIGSHRRNRKNLSHNRGTIVGGDRLSWLRFGNDLALFRGKSKKPVLHVAPDPIWPGMFRVRSRGGVSDLCNLSRAKDAGLAIALRDLNSGVQETALDGTHVRGSRRGRMLPPSDPPRIPAAPDALTVRSGQWMRRYAGLDDKNLTDTFRWSSIESASRHAQTVVGESARKADMLPTPIRGQTVHGSASASSKRLNTDIADDSR
jgi:hypothetical protein